MSNSSHNLAIAEIVIFAPLALGALILVFLHGRRGLLGWFFIHAFVMLQIIGPIIQLASNNGVSSASIIISQIGLSPGLLGIGSILHECSLDTSLGSTIVFRRVGLVLQHLFVGAGVALSVVSGTELQDRPPAANANNLRQAGVLLLFVYWLALVALIALALKRRQEFQSFKMLLYTTAPAIAAFGVQFAYRIASAFDTSDQTFSPIDGSLAVRVVLLVLPAMMAAIVLVVGGFVTVRAARERQKRTSPKQHGESGGYSMSRRDGGLTILHKEVGGAEEAE